MTITDKAAEKATSILAAEGKSNCGIRIFIAGEGCCGPSYGLNIQEDQMPNDEVIEKNGLRVYLDKQLLETLAGMQLDYYADEEREGFILTGSSPSCGPDCGCK